MKSLWEIETTPSGNTVRLIRAVAYNRHSAQDRQENSIPIKNDQVREWAAKNGVEIIHEFADAGKSGLNAEGRPAFTEMMEEGVKKRGDFHYVLCLDASRWGRFQDIDLSAQFSAECRKHQKQIVYTSIDKRTAVRLFSQKAKTSLSVVIRAPRRRGHSTPRSLRFSLARS